MTDSRLISWFADQGSFIAYERSLAVDCSVERALSRQRAVNGHCPICRRTVAFKVFNGARFDDRPNLREGLVCSSCRLTARQRTLLLALMESGVALNARPGAILERFSQLYLQIKRRYRGLMGSEYLGPHEASGRVRLWRAPSVLPIPRLVRHQSITEMSFASGSLEFLLHTDVLEHVPDTEAALVECCRVLAPGRSLIFTVPFFSGIEQTQVRGYLNADKKLVELLPAEYHGDGVRAGGIYTYYNFGWTLFRQLQAVFAKVEVGIAYSPRHGLVSADSEPGPWNMRPVVFRCQTDFVLGEA